MALSHCITFPKLESNKTFLKLFLNLFFLRGKDCNDALNPTNNYKLRVSLMTARVYPLSAFFLALTNSSLHFPNLLSPSPHSSPPPISTTQQQKNQSQNHLATSTDNMNHHLPLSLSPVLLIIRHDIIVPSRFREPTHLLALYSDSPLFPFRARANAYTRAPPYLSSNLRGNASYQS